jgi:hypothetical protein
MSDPTANPFPFSLRSGRVVVDEECACGHRRTEHGPTLAFGHGTCRRCPCVLFTWMRWVYLDPATGTTTRETTEDA